MNEWINEKSFCFLHEIHCAVHVARWEAFLCQSNSLTAKVNKTTRRRWKGAAPNGSKSNEEKSKRNKIKQSISRKKSPRRKLWYEWTRKINVRVHVELKMLVHEHAWLKSVCVYAHIYVSMCAISMWNGYALIGTSDWVCIFFHYNNLCGPYFQFSLALSLPLSFACSVSFCHHP